jgi:hypothetical protein
MALPVETCWDARATAAFARWRSTRLRLTMTPSLMRMAYSPTLPVRLIRVSSISSIVDMARDDAW